MRGMNEEKEFPWTWFCVSEVIAWGMYIVLKDALDIEQRGAQLALASAVGGFALGIVLWIHRASE
jgi:hypothetical protein